MNLLLHAIAFMGIGILFFWVNNLFTRINKIENTLWVESLIREGRER